MASVTLKKGEGRTLLGGGSWIYDNEIEQVAGDPADGSIVQIVSHDGKPMGQGYINSHSKIRVRELTRDPAIPIDEEFWKARLQAAWDYRKKVIGQDSCRIVFGEADRLPGLVIDRYNDVLAFQAETLGIDIRKRQLLRLMAAILAVDGIRIRGIYERSDAKVRTLEGLERVKGFFDEPFEPRALIHENGLAIEVDVAQGQKTGYFLDQKFNRAAIRSYAKGARVLDCFTHTGGFALNAAAAGAAMVTGVDASELAISQARRNAALNGLEKTAHFEAADVFDLLPELEAQRQRYDLIILDPPAFTKSRDSLRNALKGYREINSRAMGLLNEGGILASCSCSEFLSPELFTRTISEAGDEAHKRLCQAEYRTQAPDHPIIWGSSVSYYLKFVILQVTERGQ